MLAATSWRPTRAANSSPRVASFPTFSQRISPRMLPLPRPPPAAAWARPRGDCLASHPGSELRGTRREILGDEIENLRAHVAAAPSPPRGSVGSLDGVAHVLAIALGDLAQHTAIGSEDFATITLVGPGLFTADEELIGPINWWESAGTRNAEVGTR